MEKHHPEYPPTNTAKDASDVFVFQRRSTFLWLCSVDSNPPRPRRHGGGCGEDSRKNPPKNRMATKIVVGFRYILTNLPSPPPPAWVGFGLSRGCCLCDIDFRTPALNPAQTGGIFVVRRRREWIDRAPTAARLMRPSRSLVSVVLLLFIRLEYSCLFCVIVRFVSDLCMMSHRIETFCGHKIPIVDQLLENFDGNLDSGCLFRSSKF